MTSHRERPRRRPWARSLVVAGGVAVLGASSWWGVARSLAPPRLAEVSAPGASSPAEPAVAETSLVPVTVAKAPGTDLERALGETRVVGRLLDARGGAIAGHTVVLWHRQPRQPWPPLRDPAAIAPRQPIPEDTTTDAAGAFGFGRLAAGEYLVRCAEWPDVEVSLQLAVGQTATAELRLPADVAVVTGSLWQDGEVAEGYVVAFHDAKGERCVCRRQHDGRYRGLLAAGTYELRVAAEWGHTEGIWFSRHPLVVPSGTPTVSWRHEVGGTPCDLLVRDEAGMPRAVLGVDVNLVPAAGGPPAYFTADARVGVWKRLWLPPGRWRVHVHGTGVAAMAEREVLVEPGTPPLRLELVARPGADVDLVLRDAAGQSVTVAAELVPPLRVSGEARPCSVREGSSKRSALAFLHVPVGTAELLLADAEVDGALWFVPFEPLPPVALHVQPQASGKQAIRLVVQRRAFVDLRACLSTGREDAEACIVVWSGDRRVRGRDERMSQRWAAWLPPGDYRAAVDRGGVVREHPFSVGTRDVALRLRP